MGRMPCCEKDGLKKGPWTTEEDQKLIDHVQKYGPANWRALPKKAGLERCGKSCRLRWANYLRPDIKRGKFSVEEDESIIQLHSVMGNKWSAIAAKLPGRTDNEIKNYWNTHLRKKLLRMGIDPVTHGPRLDLLDLQSILNTLQNPSLLNIPALLNLQTVLNSDFLSSNPLQNGSQNRLSCNLLDSSFIVNSSSQLQANTNTQLIQNFPSLDETSAQTEQNAFQQKNHVISEPCFKWYDNSAFMSNNSNNNSSLSSVFSTSSCSPDNAVDDDLMYLKSGLSIEDDLEIDSFFSKILEKLDNPCSFNEGTP